MTSQATPRDRTWRGLRGEIDTIYETNNCLDDDEKEYQEYYACAFKVISIIKSVNEFEAKVGSLIEISILVQPMEIRLNNGKIIWSFDKK